jgi:ribonuclease R
VYRLGDALRVKVVRVNLDDRKLDFELDDSGAKKPASTSTARSRGERRSANKLRRRKKPRSPQQLS